MNLQCSDCGSSRRHTRLVDGDVLCWPCEASRKEHIFTFTMSINPSTNNRRGDEDEDFMESYNNF